MGHNLVGLLSGLLANSGGFLLAPLFLTVLRLPIARALGTSLAVASALAVPGTVVHAWLGHIDWALVATLAITSVPLSLVGARLALRTDPQRLERGHGAAVGGARWSLRRPLTAPGSAGRSAVAQHAAEGEIVIDGRLARGQAEDLLA